MTQACEDSRNLTLPYKLLSVLTAMLLALEHYKSHVDDDGGREGEGGGGMGHRVKK